MLAPSVALSADAFAVLIFRLFGVGLFCVCAIQPFQMVKSYVVGFVAVVIFVMKLKLYNLCWLDEMKNTNKKPNFHTNAPRQSVVLLPIQL